MHTNVNGGDSCAKVPAKNIQRDARKCLRLQSLDCTMRMRGDFEPTVDERETCGIFAETSVAKTLARVWGLSGSPRYKPFQCVADCVPDQFLIAEFQCLTPVSNPDSVKGVRFPTSPRFRDANSAPVQILADPLQHRVLTTEDPIICDSSPTASPSARRSRPAASGRAAFTPVWGRSGWPGPQCPPRTDMVRPLRYVREDGGRTLTVRCCTDARITPASPARCHGLI